MYITIYRKAIYIFVLSLILIVLLILLPYNSIKSALSQSADFSFSSKTVVIDPGHGGMDPGAIGINGCKEKDVNLAISLYLKDILLTNGYNVIMTRQTDVSLHDEKYTKTSRIKASDLKKRLAIIEENENAIAILIHQNQFTQEKYSGAQMFYGRINSQSEPLAISLQNSFKTNLQPDNVRRIKRSSTDVYVLHNSKTPTVLLECGFLSNYGEAELLCTEDYQKKVALTIFCGIADYVQSKWKD